MTVAPLTEDAATALGLAPGQLPLFLHEEWRSIVGEGYERLAVRDKDGKILGVFNLHRTRRAGLRLISHPAFSPHCGLWRRQQAKNPAKAVGEAKKLHALLAEYMLAQDGMVHLAFPPEETDLQPWAWSGFKVVAQWTYRIDLGQGLATIRAGYEDKQRNAIKKGFAGGTVEPTDDPARVLNAVRSTFARKGKGLDEETTNALLHAFLKPGRGFAFVTVENGKESAAAFCAYAAGTCYYLLGGVDKAHASNGAGAMAVDACIAQAHALGLSVFDFEGSMLPEVERYFRTFGGTPTPYFTVNRAPFLTEVALKKKLRQLF
ncbi:MAG TPA: GNAT family N-acetyltransferase [Flavobacteriales bacterium]|nr:GNAT family N-acetyltransferase [Flavobacteriales bacterium]